MRDPATAGTLKHQWLKRKILTMKILTIYTLNALNLI